MSSLTHEPDEYVMVRKTTKVFGIDKAFPLWLFLKMSPEHIKQDIERAARDLGYFGMGQNFDSYGAPEITVHFRLRQVARVTEGNEGVVAE